MDDENGRDIYLVQAYHYAQWDSFEDGMVDILDDQDLNLNVAAVRFSLADAERAAKEYVEACEPDDEKEGMMHQPLAAVNIWQIVTGQPVGEWTFVKNVMEFVKSVMEK